MAAIPRKGDKAFAGASDIDMGMGFLKVIGFDRSYVEGFKGAADTLAASIRGADAHLRYQMVLPTCQLYRHWLEIAMKYILTLGNRSGVYATPEEDLKGHELYPLWNLVKKVILALNADEPKANLGGMEGVIAQFHQIDPSGQEFRYDRKTDGTESLVKIPVEFSLANLSEVMTKADVYLTGVAMMLEAKFDGLI